MKQIFLEQYYNVSGELRYEVVKLVNSADFEIGQLIKRQMVTTLCDYTGVWTVTITKKVMT